MGYWTEYFYLPGSFYNFRVTMASNHQPGTPSLEFNNDSDSDCYTVDSGS